MLLIRSTMRGQRTARSRSIELSSATITEHAMTSRMCSFSRLVPEFESALRNFQRSKSKFCILKSINPSQGAPQESTEPPQHESPKTLFILDSSFNPPSVAHWALAQSALEAGATDHDATPHRLLLLFAVLNADKPPAPASVPQRLSLMTVFAHELVKSVQRKEPQGAHAISIDIGVTTAPYYTDKSKAIETEGREWYPHKPRHIHLVGFDTLTRIFTAKYYKDFDPPLSALNPYFDAGHQLRVTLRPSDEYGTIDEQRDFVKKLQGGEFGKYGAKREWASQVELISPSPQAGVSSTKIRKAAHSGDCKTVRQLCTTDVAEFVHQESLYQDVSGS